MAEPICDLVLLSWNHLDQTQPCLETLFRHTTVPCRLFIVDNGSEPPVRQFLAAVKPQGAIASVTLLQNEQNEGFPLGMNRGIRATTAPYVVILNNDLRFAPHWLEEMLVVARADPRIGVINPESSTFGHLQPEGTPLERYAEQIRGLTGRYTEVGMCIGFCMLVTRPLLDKIGGFTEEVERIFFEDEDFCERAREAGYRCVVASASYVFHAEHQTVKDVPEREQLFRRNQAWCEARWGRRIRIAWLHPHPLLPSTPQAREQLERVLSWVRRRTHVYLLAPVPAGATPDAVFRAAGLVPHADVHFFRVSRAAAGLHATLRILARVKKRYDVLVAPTRLLATWWRALRWWHGAEVVAWPDEARLLEAWRARAGAGARAGRTAPAQATA